MMGKRAPNDLDHLVAQCWHHNVEHPPGRKLIAAMREYLGLT
jgi:hypothetical protein